MKLSKEQVMHVADLAKLKINEDELLKYQKQLSDILTEIDKILKAEVTTDEILISPIEHINRYNEDTEGKMLTKEEIMKNVKNTNGDYIIVPRVINE